MKFQSGNHEVFVSVPDQTRLKEEISDRLSNDRGFRLATLNLDHLVKTRQDAAFARAYAAQDLIVAEALHFLHRMSKEAKPFFLYVNLQGKGCKVEVAAHIEVGHAFLPVLPAAHSLY